MINFNLFYQKSLSIVFIYFLISNSIYAVDTRRVRAKTPLTLEHATVINAKTLKSMLDQKVDLLIVDVRRTIEFSEEHIPGAIHIPYKEKSEKNINYSKDVDKFDYKKIESAPEVNIVIYCNGETCWRSYKACRFLLETKSKKNIFWLRLGIPDWINNGYMVEKGL